MKNWKKVVAGLAVAGIFAAVMWLLQTKGIYKWQQEEQEQETTKMIQGPQVQKKQEYKIGEEIKNGDLIWEVKSAKILRGYDELGEDGQYFWDEECILREDELTRNYLSDYALPYYKEDIRFLKIEYKVQNTSDTLEENISLLPTLKNYKNTTLYQKYKTYLDWNVEVLGLGGRYLITDDSGKMEEHDALELYSGGQERVREVWLQPGETMDYTCIIQYSAGNLNGRYGMILNEHIYDLYFYAYSNLAEFPKMIHLNLTENALDVSQTTPEQAYENQQNVPKMKADNFTNQELFMKTQSLYPSQHDLLVEDTFAFDEIFETEMKSKVSNYQLFSWKEFADANQNYHEGLKEMAKRYQRDFGYEAEKLKVLLVDYHYQYQYSEDITLINQGDLLNFYEDSCLFVLTPEKKAKMFGYADDIWVADSTQGNNFGPYPAYAWMQNNDEITLQAAYILTPDIYEKEEALYFCGDTRYRDRYRSEGQWKMAKLTLD